MPPSTLEVEPPRPEDFGTSPEEVEAYEATLDRLTTLQARLVFLGGPVGGLLWIFLVEEATVRFGGVLFVPAYMVAGLLAAALIVGGGGMLLWYLLGTFFPGVRRVRAYRAAREAFRSWWSAEPPELPRGVPPPGRTTSRSPSRNRPRVWDPPPARTLGAVASDACTTA